MLYHLALVRDWEDALAAGEYRISAPGVSLEREGFVHTSRSHQLRGVAEAFYAGVDRPLVLLHIDESALTSPWRFDDVPGAEPFPHVYGPIVTAAVVAAVPVHRDPDGVWHGFPPGV